jgi:hypothetical protein
MAERAVLPGYEPPGLPGHESMMPQLSFDDGADRRDRAIEAVEQHADAAWIALAYDAVLECARSMARFTTDDVWQVLASRRVGPPPEPRAMGAVMNRARREKVIRPTNVFVATKRPQAHCSPTRVWEVWG